MNVESADCSARWSISALLKISYLSNHYLQGQVPISCLLQVEVGAHRLQNALRHGFASGLTAWICMDLPAWICQNRSQLLHPNLNPQGPGHFPIWRYLHHHLGLPGLEGVWILGLWQVPLRGFKAQSFGRTGRSQTPANIQKIHAPELGKPY